MLIQTNFALTQEAILYIIIIKMGHIYTDIELVGQTKRIRLKKVLIDTGASYTVIEPKLLESISAPKLPGRFKIELGDGRKVIAYAYGCEGKIGKHYGPVIAVTFPKAKNVIGVETLESLGLRFNLRKQKLEETRPPGLAYFY